jgi:hypothetical protein
MPRQGTLAKLIRNKKAWKKDSIDPAGLNVYRLPDTFLEILEESARKRRISSSSPITEFRLDETEINKARRAVSPELEALESGSGFVIIEREPVERVRTIGGTPNLLYWLVGQCLGLPFDQDIEGTLLYDVRDTGDSVSEGSRFSVTKSESSFHTDGAFGCEIPDYVGLLCLNTAKSGGRSQLISVYSLHNYLLANHPEALETLYEPFCFDRRGQVAPGELPYSQYPIFHWDDRELTMRYLHYYIEVGHEKSDWPMTLQQVEALKIVNDVLSRQDFRVEFDLQPGQMIFMNNHWILHNRTAYEDDTDPQQRRHYVRLWLKRASTSVDHSE